VVFLSIIFGKTIAPNVMVLHRAISGQGLLEVDVAHAGETWEHAREKIMEALESGDSLSSRRFKNCARLWFDVGSLHHWSASNGFFAPFG
jgi:hypothetical protein